MSKLLDILAYAVLALIVVAAGQLLYLIAGALPIVCIVGTLLFCVVFYWSIIRITNRWSTRG